MSSKAVESMTVESRARMFSSLGDPIRLLILDLLADGRMCVCELQEQLSIAMNLLSYHLRVLREAGLVEATRRGRWVDYCLTEDLSDLVRSALPENPSEHRRLTNPAS